MLDFIFYFINNFSIEEQRRIHLDRIMGCSTKKRDKDDIYWCSYSIHIFVFLTLLRIFVPRLEIRFCINHYFLLFISKYRTSPHDNSGLEF